MIDRVNLLVRRLDEGATIPTYAHNDDAGMDIYALKDGAIEAGDVAMVGTGIILVIPEGHVGLVHPRSGLAARYGVTVLNSPGTIDSGYRGELKVLLHNTSRETFLWKAGDRIAQLIVQRYVKAEPVEVGAGIPDSVRGEFGFGSTGT